MQEIENRSDRIEDRCHADELVFVDKNAGPIDCNADHQHTHADIDPVGDDGEKHVVFPSGRVKPVSIVKRREHTEIKRCKNCSYERESPTSTGFLIINANGFSFFDAVSAVWTACRSVGNIVSALRTFDKRHDINPNQFIHPQFTTKSIKINKKSRLSGKNGDWPMKITKKDVFEVLIQIIVSVITTIVVLWKTGNI